MVVKTVTINRAPVLTLWATVVAERLGFDPQEALTLGKAVAGLNAQAKGQRLGIFHPREDTPDRARARERGETFLIEILSRPVPAMNTDEGLRAAIKGQPISPESVQGYLEGKFGPHLAAVREAMEALALALSPDELATRAYALYEKFRPSVPEGKRGWGAQGELDLEYVRSLAGRT